MIECNRCFARDTGTRRGIFLTLRKMAGTNQCVQLTTGQGSLTPQAPTTGPSNKRKITGNSFFYAGKIWVNNWAKRVIYSIYTNMCGNARIQIAAIHLSLTGLKT